MTPIKHLVILFPENRSFDHYFGTYPHALNLPGEPRFEPRPKPSIRSASGQPKSSSVRRRTPTPRNNLPRIWAP